MIIGTINSSHILQQVNHIIQKNMKEKNIKKVPDEYACFSVTSSKDQHIQSHDSNLLC